MSDEEYPGVVGHDTELTEGLAVGVLQLFQEALDVQIAALEEMRLWGHEQAATFRQNAVSESGMFAWDAIGDLATDTRDLATEYRAMINQLKRLVVERSYG